MLLLFFLRREIMKQGGNGVLETWGASIYDALIKDDVWKLYIKGLVKTLEIAACAVILGAIIGVVIAIIKVSAAQSKRHGAGHIVLKIAEAVCNLYLTIIRGTPVMLQLLIIYFSVFASSSDGTMAAILGFGINSGAYVAEIVRSGIQSINKGQTEAGRSLGLSAGMTMRLIVLPQAVKNILPALFNEFITLLKETSVAGTIAVVELTKVSTNIKTLVWTMTPLYIVALIYLTMVVLLGQVQKRLERRLAAGDRR